MGLMSPRWLKAYKARIFTEFQEHRAPGHAVLGKNIWQKGMLDLINECIAALKLLGHNNDKEANLKKDELKAMKIAAEVLIKYAERHAGKLEHMAEKESDPKRKNELLEMATICQRVPAHAPQTFHEASAAQQNDTGQ